MKRFGFLIVLVAVAIVSFSLGNARAYQTGVAHGVACMESEIIRTGNGVNVPTKDGGVKFHLYDRLSSRSPNTEANLGYLATLKEQWKGFKTEYGIDVATSSDTDIAFKRVEVPEGTPLRIPNVYEEPLF